MAKFEALDFLIPVLTFVCLGLLVASAATAFAVDNSSGADISYGLIYSCSQSKCSNAAFTCTSRQNTRIADAAFTVAGCITMGLAFVISMCRLFGNRKYFHNYRAKFVMYSVLLLIVLTFAFSLVETILGFLLFGISFCEVKFADSASSVKIGPHAPLAVSACVMSMISACLEFCFELLARHGEDE